MQLLSGWLNHLHRSVAASIAALLICTMLLGCTSAQRQEVKTVVGEIGQEIPKVLPLVNTAALIATVVMPAEGPLIQGVTNSVNVGLVELSALCDAYSKAPSDSVWASIQAAVTQLVNTGAEGLLDAARITDPDTRQRVTLALGTMQTALLLIDGLVQQAQTKQQLQASAALRTFRLQQVRPYLDQEMVARETGYSFDQVMGYESQFGF